jgi:hypothetical protein
MRTLDSTTETVTHDSLLRRIASGTAGMCDVILLTGVSGIDTARMMRGIEELAQPVRLGGEQSKERLDTILVPIVTELRFAGGTSDTLYEAVLRAPLQNTPSWLVALESAITQAHWVTELESDWDDEDAPAITPATFARAKHVLGRFAERGSELHLTVPVPSIAPGSKGSIDFFWELPSSRSLLINIPASGEESPSFSALKSANPPLSGYLDEPARLEQLLQFLNPQ